MPVGKATAEIFRTDAKADGDDVVVAGGIAGGGVSPGSARWFSVRLTPTNSPWIYCRGEPYRVIAALELFATLNGRERIQ